MSKTQRTIQFSVCIDDYERWTPEHLAECESNIHAGSYDDWVTNQLEDVMRKAGMEFIKANSDLFCYEDII